LNRFAHRKERFLHDSNAVRLGNIAANLARIKSFSNNPANQAAVRDLLGESRYFIEWSAAELELKQQIFLRLLMRRLTRWMRTQHYWNSSPQSRLQLSMEAGVWSERILAQSRLVTGE